MNEISVIVAVYNGERYLREAIESILAQTAPPLEILVVDDGSSDESAAVAAGFGEKVRCYSRPHEGVGAALNFGISQARGDFFAFLDADDLWCPEKLARQMVTLLRPAAPDMVFGHAEPFLSPELAATARKNTAAANPAAPGFLKGTMLIPRGAFDQVGDFDTTRRLGDFIDWFLRAREAGLTSEMLPEVVLKRRIHDANTVTVEKHLQTDYVKILKASLDRRRGGTPGT
ncbi:MAG: glycosyltransferase family 2 protein [Cytophagales bacterium]|nr:glycosyltransferase family 2 protein [Armatimonadota bacterium]